MTSTAYLTPLLSKHNIGKTITYEDLITSYDTAKEQLATTTNNNINISQSSKEELETLHKSQLEAYRITALKELETYASTTFQLPPIRTISSITLQNYIEGCIRKSQEECDGWKNIHMNVLEEVVLNVVKEKADRYYHSQQQMQDGSKSPTSNNGNNEVANKTCSTSKISSMDVIPEEQPQSQDEEHNNNENHNNNQADDTEEEGEHREDELEEDLHLDEDDILDEHTTHEDHVIIEPKISQEAATTSASDQQQSTKQLQQKNRGNKKVSISLKSALPRKAQQNKKRVDATALHKTGDKRRRVIGGSGGRGRRKGGRGGKNILS